MTGGISFTLRKCPLPKKQIAGLVVWPVGDDVTLEADLIASDRVHGLIKRISSKEHSLEKSKSQNSPADIDLFEVDWNSHNVDNMANLLKHFWADAVTGNKGDSVTTAVGGAAGRLLDHLARDVVQHSIILEITNFYKLRICKKTCYERDLERDLRERFLLDFRSLRLDRLRDLDL